jgi:hypothetical protein
MRHDMNRFADILQFCESRSIRGRSVVKRRDRYPMSGFHQMPNNLERSYPDRRGKVWRDKQKAK